MAFLLKRYQKQSSNSSSQQGGVVIDQWIQVTCPSRTIPATTTDQLFRVRGGRVLVRSLIGEVTTVIQAQADTLSITSKKLDAAGAAVGTAVVVASAVDMTGREVGGNYFVEGDGTAGVLSNAGATFAGTNTGVWVAPQGEIYATTSATNTGALKWDIWYQPLDPGAYIDPVVVATVAI